MRISILVACLIGLVACGQGPVPTTTAAEAPSRPELRLDVRTSLSDHGLAEAADRLFDLVNDFRREHDLQTLEFHAIPGQAALRHSEDMARRAYFSHMSPDGLELGDRMRPGLPATRASENIWEAKGKLDADSSRLAQHILDAWSSSAAHRANLLDPSFTHQGIALAGAADELKAVQVLIAVIEEPR